MEFKIVIIKISDQKFFQKEGRCKKRNSYKNTNIIVYVNRIKKSDHNIKGLIKNKLYVNKIRKIVNDIQCKIRPVKKMVEIIKMIIDLFEVIKWIINLINNINPTLVSILNFIKKLGIV